MDVDWLLAQLMQPHTHSPTSPSLSTFLRRCTLAGADKAEHQSQPKHIVRQSVSWSATSAAIFAVRDDSGLQEECKFLLMSGKMPLGATRRLKPS